MRNNAELVIDGSTAPGWECVRDAFAATFDGHGPGGAAVCVYCGGRPVADLAAAAMTESALGLGFTLPTAERPLGGPGSFGAVGLGGCRAWAVPEAGLAFAYLPAQLLDTSPDPREVTLTRAVLTAAKAARIA